MATPSTAPAGRLPDALRAALGTAGVPVVTDPALLAGCATDWTGRWTGPVLGLVRPHSTAQVVQALGAARAAGVPVQVQGGNTGLVAGSVPDRPSLVVSTTALRTTGPVDVRERSVRVGAGCALSLVATQVRRSGLSVGVDLAARDSATIGGLVATNAGGVGVFAHGMMREQVRGLTAVLADGRVVSSVGRPRKDNAGYDLAGLLIGSEGTLGVVTEVELALHVPPGPTTVALLASPSLEKAVDLARAVELAGASLVAAEVVDAAGTRRAATTLGLHDPLAGEEWLLVLEVADGASGDGVAAVGEAVVALGTTARERERLWSYREAQTELYARLAGPRVEKLDVSVRLDRLDALVAAVHEAVRGRAEVGLFGHALDGNLHVQLIPGSAIRASPGSGGSPGVGGSLDGGPPAAGKRAAGDAGGGVGPALVDDVLAAVAALGGGISAEHGIGRLKARHLPLARGADEISWMRQVKASVDPVGLLNPGVLLPADG